MTNLQILFKAVEHAEKNGFDYNGFLTIFYNNLDEFQRDWFRREWFLKNVPYEIIYNKEFLKAFYGEKGIDISINTEGFGGDIWVDFEHEAEWSGDSWKYHAQQQVISDDPIKYISQFLK